MCCREDQVCCDEKEQKTSFKLLVNGRNKWHVSEEDGAAFAAWLSLNVGWKFYKGMIENLEHVGIAYKDKI